jgi:hypothetical protein
MSMPQENVSDNTATEPKRRGRKLGGHNKPGHRAGRPRKPPELFAQSVWENGRAFISVEQPHIDKAMRANSSHCAIAMAIAEQVPTAKFISVDVQTIRYSCSKRKLRFVFLTPHAAQALVIGFDQGDAEACKPVSFSMKPAFITKIGQKRTHAPSNEELKGLKPRWPRSNRTFPPGITPRPRPSASLSAR